MKLRILLVSGKNKGKIYCYEWCASFLSSAKFYPELKTVSLKCTAPYLSTSQVTRICFFTICDPPQDFDAKGESTLTTRLLDTLSLSQITGYAHIKLLKQRRTQLVVFRQLSTPNLLFLAGC